MSKLVPLLDEGADELERTLLAAAQQDAPVDGAARARTLAAVKAASRTAAVAGAAAVGLRWLHLVKPTLPWLAVGGLAMAVTVGGGAFILREGATEHARASHAAPALPMEVAPSSHALALPPAAPSATTAPSPATTERRAIAIAIAPTARAKAAPASKDLRAAPHATPTAARTATAPIASSAPPDPLPPHSASPEPAPPASRDGSAAPGPAMQASSLRAEAALLESVRASLAASRVDRALASLDEYDARFVGGSLEEEATVLRIEALLAAHRPEGARAVVSAFERKHPASSYLPRMRARAAEP